MFKIFQYFKMASHVPEVMGDINKINNKLKQMEKNIIENDRAIAHITRLTAQLEVKLKQLENSLKRIRAGKRT